ncbi:uncharacterized protein LACBIDRAFT_332799 [Laccaria bicolor S238N-H82]|uniref:Predicted protein n=1 Tax=Laccaria bicolor (strain S238N-H82 / ATCC MYA-4686) TaxID=486041 RepID=B0DTR6_LACBS|nr:uncharacterized protein LACBIDRAFT_332799 [Laccaria bicolor S238N-H82]EDR02028.1 predicted protein [Laccaria bicolor S238N-H82]|eukprot:XP_001887419.1 predicted protein [Laccaria bicolor S238N-H82]
MYNLSLEYCEEEESSKSTQSRVVFYATKPSLAQDKVVDRGMGTSMQHYMVDKPLLEQITHTANKLQVFIQHMASLIEERTKYFQVDPEDTLLKVLGGAETTSQLHAAWLCLASRLEAAQKFMLKYQQEYQNATIPPSPVSMNPDIHKYISGLPDVDDKLWNMQGTIPRHVDKLSLDARQRLLEANEKWGKIIPAPPWLATPAQKTSSPILNIPARTSYKAASSFTLPDKVKPPELTQRKQALTTWKGSKAVQFTPQVEAWEPSQSSALMSSSTPFKSLKGLFSQDEESNPGPFPSSGPNRHVSVGNFLYGTDEVPSFSPDRGQFSGFFYPSHMNATPSNPTTRPITSTPWSMASGAMSFHSMPSQKSAETINVQETGFSHARTQASTSHIATENVSNAQRIRKTKIQCKTRTNVTLIEGILIIHQEEGVQILLTMTLPVIQEDMTLQGIMNAEWPSADMVAGVVEEEVRLVPPHLPQALLGPGAVILVDPNGMKTILLHHTAITSLL